MSADGRFDDDERPAEVTIHRSCRVIYDELWVKALDEGKRFPRVTWCSGARMWRWTPSGSNKCFDAPQVANGQPVAGEFRWVTCPIRDPDGQILEHLRKRDITSPYRLSESGILQWQARAGECTAIPGSWHPLDTCPMPAEPGKQQCRKCESVSRSENMLFKVWFQQNKPQQHQDETRSFKSKREGTMGRFGT